MFDISMIFKIGAVGVIMIIINSILRSSGKDDIATAVYIAEVVILLGMVSVLIYNLFNSVRTMFYF